MSQSNVLPLPAGARERIEAAVEAAFEAQIALFDEAVRAIASRDEPDDWNPLAASARGLQGEALRRATARIYGAALGDYGAGVTERVERGAWDARADLGLDISLPPRPPMARASSSPRKLSLLALNWQQMRPDVSPQSTLQLCSAHGDFSVIWADPTCTGRGSQGSSCTASPLDQGKTEGSGVTAAKMAC